MRRQKSRIAFLLSEALVFLIIMIIFPVLSSNAFQKETLPRVFARGSVFTECSARGGGRFPEFPGGAAPSARVPSISEEASKARLEAGYGKFPLLFEKNGGQSTPEVAFTVKGSDKTLYFTPEGLTFSLAVPREPDGENPESHRLSSRPEERGRPGGEAPRERWTLKLDFVDAARVRPEGKKPAETVISYFKGPESEHRSGVPTYNSIVYKDLWPGIDLVYDGDANHLKYRFVVRPGADPERIRLAYRGAERLSVDGEGGLEVVTAAGVLRDDAPLCWQETDEGRVPVNATYALGRRETGNGGPNTSLDYGFSVESYDPTKELIIDPVVLIYCGFIGGSGSDWGRGIAVDGSGNAYVTGVTWSTETTFPVTVGPDPTHNGSGDAFVAKVKADGTGLVYCGYIGGAGSDSGYGIAVDGSGNACVTGQTSSDETTFPVKVGPDPTYNGSGDAFVAKVNAAGTGLVYCGYIGGAESDSGYGIAVDGSGNAYVTGDTWSTETTFPVKVGPDPTHNGGADAFVAKVNAAGTGLVYCGYIGGAGSDSGYGIAVDGSGNACVTGQTVSDETTFPVAVGPDPTCNGGWDAFVAKVNAAGTSFVYCGYIGGSNHDYGRCIAVDSSGNAYVTGDTDSTEATFPVNVGPDLTHNGGGDVFVAKVNAAGTTLVYCGYIGGFASEWGHGIAVDGSGNAYVTGNTRSDETTFPVTVGPDPTYNGGDYDAFVAKVNAAGTGLVYCGYIGGKWDDRANGIAVDASGNAYVTGGTQSDETTFPVTVGPDLTCNGGIDDAFVAKIAPVSASGAWVISGVAGSQDYLYRYEEAAGGTSAKSQWTFVGAKAGVVAGMSKDVCWIGEKNNEFLYSRNADGSWTWHAPQIRSVSPYGENAVWIVEKNSEFVFRYQGGVWTWNAARAKQVSAVSGDVLWLIERDSGNVYRHTVSTNTWEWTPVKGLSLSAASSNVVWVVKLEDNRLYRYDHGTKEWEWQPVEALSVSAISESEAYYVGVDGALYHFDKTTGTKTKILDSCGGVSSYPPAALSGASGGAAASSTEGSGGSGCTAASLSPLALLLLLPLGALLKK